MVQRRLEHGRWLILRDCPVGDELIREDLPHGRMLVDDLIHLRLGERRLVAFVMTPAPVPHQIDQKILAKRLPVFERHTHGHQARFRLVGIDMHDRNLETLGQIARVEGRAGVAGYRGKADLIVDDDVDGAAGGIAWQGGEVECLCDDTLTGECGIAVDQDGHAGLVVADRLPWLIADVLRRPDHPDDDRIDRFEVAGIRRERHRHLDHPAMLAHQQPGPEMVFDVAREFLGGSADDPTAFLRHRPPRMRQRSRHRACPAHGS